MRNSIYMNINNPTKILIEHTVLVYKSYKSETLCQVTLNMQQISMIRHVFENVFVLEDMAGLQELDYIHYRIIIKCTCNTYDMNITDNGFKAQEARLRRDIFTAALTRDIRLFLKIINIL